MRFKTLLSLSLSIASYCSCAQWLPNGATTGNIYYNNGNVGIGTDSPLGLLHTSGVGNNSWVYFGGNINGSGNPQNNHGLAFGWNKSGGSGESSIVYNTSLGTNPRLDFSSYNGSVFTTELTLKGGNVGIGTVSPGYKLEVAGAGHFTGRLSQNGSIPNDNNAAFWNMDATGYGLYSQGGLGIHYSFHFLNQAGSTILYGNGNGIGVGTYDVNAKLKIVSDGSYNSNEVGVGQDHILLNGPMPGNGGYYGGITWESGSRRRASIVATQENADTDYVGLAFFTKGTDGAGPMHESMRIAHSGNVGIGTSSPDAPLTVKGVIHTNEVRVDVNAPIAPDYVFEKDYNLLPLSEVEAYVNQNKHLPEVPSAKEMEENGLNLKEMNLLLLKKVEELTLHLIELKKEIQEQQKEIDHLKKS